MQSQLEDEACPLIRRVGTFAAALRMKKSWHGTEHDDDDDDENADDATSLYYLCVCLFVWLLAVRMKKV